MYSNVKGEVNIAHLEINKLNPLNVADALKLLLKEYVAPTQANIILFFLGPVLTLIFSLLGYLVIPFGSGLFISDYSLGLLYMFSVGSISGYGILLAGFSSYNNFRELYLKLTYTKLFSLVFVCYMLPPIFLFNLFKDCWDLCVFTFIKFARYNAYYNIFNYLTLIWLFKVKVNLEIKSIIRRFHYFKYLKTMNYPYKSKYNFILPLKVNLKNTQKRMIHTTRPLNSTHESDFRSLHEPFIKELFKDRKAPVIAFSNKSILATCYDWSDKKK